MEIAGRYTVVMDIRNRPTLLQSTSASKSQVAKLRRDPCPKRLTA